MRIYRNRFSHSVPTMMALAKTTEDFLSHLPAEFTKKDFEAARKMFVGHPLSLQSCRDYGFVVVVRTEPATYTRQEPIWVDAKGRKYTYDEMRSMNNNAIATLFNRPDLTGPWISIYDLPYNDEDVEYPCERNIFCFNAEKFKRFLEENT